MLCFLEHCVGGEVDRRPGSSGAPEQAAHPQRLASSDVGRRTLSENPRDATGAAVQAPVLRW